MWSEFDNVVQDTINSINKESDDGLTFEVLVRTGLLGQVLIKGCRCLHGV